MRSSVSVILSSPPPDTTMSYPDYSAHPQQHHSLLVLVKQVGCHLKIGSFNKLFEKISRVNHLKVKDSTGHQRPVHVNYRREYPVENNDWGDFQAHRRVLGLITIGEVSSQSDLNEICKQHESLKVRYTSTLYDSRCIILGVNSDGSIHQADSSRGSSPDLNGVDPNDNPPDRDSGVYENNNVENRQIPEEVRTTNNKHTHLKANGSDSGSECTSEISSGGGGPEEPLGLSLPPDSPGNKGSDGPPSLNSSTHSSLQPPMSFKTRAFFYPTGEHALNIETQIQEFISSLFWVVEYKRMEKSHEKFDKPQLLCAPFERKDMIGLDMDSRTNKKKCSGRLKKNLADLSLQVGLTHEALILYTQAIDILKGCNDWLWLAACYEGLCSTSVMLLYPKLFQNNVLQRYSSLGVGGNKICSSPTSTPPALNKNNSVNSNSLPPGLDPSVAKQSLKNCLLPEDIVEKYKEAIVHYSKYRNAGVIETEASIKAVHVLIEQRKYLVAAEFLSNVVFINLQLSDEEKIIRFTALSDLYTQIGFHRKAAFFRRVAAMRCVAPQNHVPDWKQCYRLLLMTLHGYRINIDLNAFVQDGRPGWPALQIQILQELVGTSRRMSEHSLCTRHQAFLLSAMLPHFNPHDLQETYKMLEAVSVKSPSGPQALSVLGTGVIIPPVNFYNIPFCKYVKVVAPSREKKVDLRDEEAMEDPGPFIFSPYQSMVVSKAAGVVDFEWVEGDVCEVKLALINTLQFQIKFSSMSLLTDGIDFEPWTSTVVLEPDNEVQLVSLRGRPQEAGELRITGYSSCLSGVTSHCRFKALSHLKVPFYTLNIVPALPCVQIFCDSSSSGTGLVSEGGLEENNKVCLTLNAGETSECNIVIHNVSSQAVECVEVEIEATITDTPLTSRVFQYSLENLKAQLPIAPGGRASLTLYVYAASDFLVPPGFSLEEEDLPSMMSGGSEGLSGGGGPSSLISRQSMLMSSLKGNKAKRAQSSASMASSRSGSSIKSGSSSSAFAMSSVQASTTTMPTVNVQNKTVEGTVKISYSGGKGMESKCWRVADVRVSVEVVPSLLVTRWDALPAEVPGQCYIVLDLLNSAQGEMDLQYTSHKRILIQGGESCRVPVPVDRCPINKLNEKPKEEEGVSVVRSQSEILGDHIASLVELNWTLGPNDTPGRAKLQSITFPPATHHLITMAPIHWDIKLNGETIGVGTENCGTTGQVQELSVGVSNASGSEISSLTVVLTAYQDNQNGSHNYRLDAKMAATGATKYIITKLNPEETFEHKCGLIFFTAGVFKIDMSCSPSSQTPSNIYENDIYSQSSPSNIWKLAPPIEIVVSDLN